jgi:hypothetical protein
MIWADIRSPFESFVPTVRHKVHSGAALEEHPQKNKKLPPQVSGTGRFRFGGESSYCCGAGCGAICGVVSATDFKSTETARGITEEEVLTSRVR